MRSPSKRLILFSIPVLIGLFLIGTAQATVYRMTGEISAIEKDSSTVVIEVPREDDTFTIAGPLALDARLTRNGQSALLKDFNKGETVDVRWHSIKNGHVIDRLTLRKRSK